MVVCDLFAAFDCSDFLFADDLSSLKNWFKKVTELEPCQKAAELLLKGQGASVFKAYHQKLPAPVPTSDTPACNEQVVSI